MAQTSAPPLWQHQKDGIARITGQPGTLLAFEMGTGKTRTALEALLAILETDKPPTPRVLIVCPKKVCSVWPAEVKLYAPSLRACILNVGDGTMKHRAAAVAAALQNPNGCMVIINYEAVWQPIMAKLLTQQSWTMIVADESHRLKSPQGRTSKFMATLALFSAKRVLLTGTPMPHSPLDIWGQMRFLDARVFGRSFTQFRLRFAICDPIYPSKVIRFRDLDTLKLALAPFVSRVRKADVLDLPKTLHVTHYCDLPPAARNAYAELENNLVALWGAGSITVTNALTHVLRMQQLANGYLPITTQSDAEMLSPQVKLQQIHSSKLDMATEILSDLPENEPIVFFCLFHADLDAVHTAAKEAGRDSLELSGRRNELAEWQAGKAPVLAVQIQAGGVGVDMTRACYCVFYSTGFNMGNYLQALARLDRQGQTRPVTYLHLVARHTIDQKIQRALEARAKLIQSVVDSDMTLPSSPEIVRDMIETIGEYEPE